MSSTRGRVSYATGQLTQWVRGATPEAMTGWPTSAHRNTAITMAGVAVALGVVGGTLAGSGVFQEHGVVLAGIIGGLLCCAVAISGPRRWRLLVYGVIAFMPLSGVPVLLFPESEWALLAKDIFFVLPAYVGCVVARPHLLSLMRAVPRSVALPVMALGVWVVVEVFNPRGTSIGAAILGLKAWLMYVPLLWLGYILFDSKEQVLRAFRAMGAMAVIPAVAGLGQVLAIASGRGEIALWLHTRVMEARDQSIMDLANYATSLEGELAFHRVPSLFTSVAQYFLFSLSMVGVTYANLRFGRKSARLAYVLVFGLVVLGGLLSGSRSPFLMMPAMLLLIFILDKKGRGVWIVPLGVLGVALAATVTFLGTTVKASYGVVFTLLGDYLLEGQSREFLLGLERGGGLVGRGTGAATAAARYLRPDVVVLENYAGKAAAELGIIGLGLVGWILLALIGVLLRGHMKIRDPEIKAASAGLISFIIVLVLNLWKGNFLDMDPVNVYFWLLAGIALSMPSLGAVGKGPTGAAIR